MDENTWRFAQLMMWLIGIQTTVLIAAFAGMWISISQRFNALDNKFEAIDKKFESVEKKFESIERKLEKIEVQISDIDKRVFGIETMLHMKECCMLKSDQNLKKVDGG